MRPVIFVKYFDKGSTVLGGHQMAAALEEVGVESRVAYGSEIADVRDSILVFIKKGRVHHLLGARARDNLTVLDVQDTLCFKRRLKNRPLYHGMIFRSQKTLDDFGPANGRAAKIYLQWNPRYRPHRVSDGEFRLAYLGDPRSFDYWQRLPQVTCVPEERFFTAAPDFNCHISIRTAPRDVLYKPTCKISSAAACGANLITTRDEASLEVLGADYPFYTDSDPESVARAIEFARESLGGPLWRAGLEKMSAVRESHDLEVIVRQYRTFLSRLGGSGARPEPVAAGQASR